MQVKSFHFLFLLILMAAGICPYHVPSFAQQMVIVDSDMGIDDVMAIIYLVQRPTVDVKAITIAQGISNVETGTEIALGLLSMLGRSDIPVAKGRPNPLRGKNSFPETWHPSADKPYGLNLPLSSAKASDMTVTEIVRIWLSSHQRR